MSRHTCFNGISGTLMGTNPESIKTDAGMVYDCKTGMFLYDANSGPVYHEEGDKIVDKEGNIVFTGYKPLEEDDPRNQYHPDSPLYGDEED